jgi:hypothetical protein
MSEEQKEQDLLAHLQRDVYCQVHARGREPQTQQHKLINNLLRVGCPLIRGDCVAGSICCDSSYTNTIPCQLDVRGPPGDLTPAGLWASVGLFYICCVASAVC